MSSDLRPPRKACDILTFARRLRLPDGLSADELWVPETEPSQLGFLNAVKSGKYRKFVIVAPSQRGKTLKSILCPTLHAISEKRQSVGFIMPSLDKLTQTFEGKLRPAIEKTGFAAWLPTKGGGSKGGKPSVLTLRDPKSGLVAGRIYFLATGTGGRETSVSSVTTQTLVFDEGDDANSAGQLELVFKRIESFGLYGFAFIASTVNDRGNRDSHPILDVHALGTRHRLHHLCHHCTGYFIPEQEHIDLEKGALVCPLCAVVWTEVDRIAALNHSVWCAACQTPAEGVAIGDIPDGSIYSELTTTLDYNMSVMSNIVAEFRAAKSAELRSDFSLMRTFQYKSMCRDYQEPLSSSEITNEGLAGISSRSDYDKRTIPNWATHLAAAVDIQGDRLYWLIVGIGPDDRFAIIDWGYESYVPPQQDRTPTPSDRRRCLTELEQRFNHGWQVEGSDTRMSPLAGLRGVDVGYYTDEIVSWLRGVKGWRACRGVGKDQLKQLGKIIELPPEAKAFVELRQPDGWPFLLCNVIGDTVRRWVHAALLRDPYTPASGMIPRGLKSNDILCLHLSGEVEAEASDGKLYVKEVRIRHDLLDCLIYAIGLSRLRTGVQTVNANHKKRKYGTVGSISSSIG